MNISDFIIKPIITEKSLEEAKSNRYTFLVPKKATKIDIKHVVEKLFNVKVKNVLTSHIKKTKTKLTRYGRRVSDLSVKKASVMIETGQKIDIFEEKTEEKKK